MYMVAQGDCAVDLTGSEIQVLLECLKYSIQRISDAQGTPYPVRQENLQRLYALQEKLRQVREPLGPTSAPVAPRLIT